MTESRDPSYLSVQDGLPILEATPSVLRMLLAPLPAEWLDFRETPEAWSPRMVIVHFIHNERTNWIPRAKVILSPDDERRFVPFQQMPPPGELYERSIDALLKEFASLREESLEALRGLNLRPEDYLRTGEHPVLGTVNLGHLISTWVVHDLNHTHQILKSLAKRHAGAVGPWRPNLAILDL